MPWGKSSNSVIEDMNPRTRLAEKTHRRTCKDCLRASKKGSGKTLPSPFLYVTKETRHVAMNPDCLAFRILNIGSLFACVNRSHHVSPGQTMPRNVITDFRKGEEV
jgi:hypothetical protein